jgi:DNA helicase II / ATP-dependent DNA helicase PcrA
MPASRLIGVGFDLLADLNSEQRRAVETVHGPVCILAGAGSGKTTTITRRIAHQVRSGEFEAKNILAVTFTTKAAGELAERLERLGAPGVPAKTFHAAALSQLQILGERSLQVLPSKVRLVREALDGVPSGGQKAALQDLASEIERAKNRRVGPEQYEAEFGTSGPVPGDLMAKVYARYEQLKRAAGQVDFEDLLEQAILMYETNERALARFRARYLAITVDEYQDVNLLQQTLLERWLDRREELCVVGDDYQAIFSFTGASSRYLLEMPDRYPNAQVIRLERNYRSTRQVLEFANRLAPWLGGAQKTLRGDARGPSPVLKAFPGPGDETLFIVREIQRLHRERVPYEEMAILYRTNFRSPDYEQALHAAGIPFQVAGGGFLARPAMRSALRGLTSESTGIVMTVERLLKQAQYEPSFETAELSQTELTRRQDLTRLLELAREYEDGETTVRNFAAHLRDRFDSEQPKRAVKLSTFHLAKGLEWDVVFLPRLEQRELPFYRAIEQGDQ